MKENQELLQQQIDKLEGNCKDFKERITNSERNFESLTKSYEQLIAEHNVSINNFFLI